jgi:hypothetical protein
MITAKKSEAEQAAADKKIAAEKKLADTSYEQADNPENPVEKTTPEKKAIAADDAAYAKTQAKRAKQQDSDPNPPPVMATTLDIPANEPYPTGKPQQPSFAEINGLVPPATTEG